MRQAFAFGVGIMFAPFTLLRSFRRRLLKPLCTSILLLVAFVQALLTLSFDAFPIHVSLFPLTTLAFSAAFVTFSLATKNRNKSTVTHISCSYPLTQREN